MSIFLINPYIYQVTDIPVDRIANTEAMSFNGTDAYVDAGSLSLNSNTGTVSAWIKTSYTSDFQIIAAVDSSPYTQLQLRVLNTGVIRLTLSYGSTFTILNSTSTVNDGNWHNVTFTYSSSGMKIYIDGSLNVSNTVNVTPLTTATDNFLIGARRVSGALSNNFAGSIDEVAIFNTALSASKIQEIYDATAVVNGVSQTANLFTGGLSSSLVYWNRMGDS